MATINEIKQQAAAVKNATQVGENTAERVGGALAGLAEIAEQQDSKLSGLFSTENNNFKLQSALFASLLRTNIFAAIIDNHYYDSTTGQFKEAQSYCCIQLFPINASSFKLKLALHYIGVIEYDENLKFNKRNSIYELDDSARFNKELEVSLDGNTKYVGIFGQKMEVAYSPDSFKDSYIIINGVPNQQFGNLLYNKKWCCCGDSFSVAGYNPEDGIPQDVYVYQDGPYKGKQKVYGTMIALRNSMNFVNIANGGMTMCNIGGTRTNSFTYNDYYKKIPLDSDYVTIKFGINDGNFNSPIGTIDDEVVTTFYGAWNVVLKWIRNNLPFTKVGIIVSSGLGKTQISDNLAEATRNVAQKWGIPILDEINDKTIPLLHRTNRPGLSSDVYDLLIEKFSVNTATGNTHPNVKAHEFESTFVEDFLRKL